MFVFDLARAAIMAAKVRRGEVCGHTNPGEYTCLRPMPCPIHSKIQHYFQQRENYAPDHCGAVIFNAASSLWDVDYCNRPQADHVPEPSEGGRE